MTRFRALLESHLDTFEKVEVTVAVHRAGAPRLLADLGTELMFDLEAIRAVARELLDRGILEPAGTDQVFIAKAFRSPELAELARVYAEDRVAVLTQLTSIAMDRIRGMAAQTFSDALSPKKPPGEDR